MFLWGKIMDNGISWAPGRQRCPSDGRADIWRCAARATRAARARTLQVSSGPEVWDLRSAWCVIFVIHCYTFSWLQIAALSGCASRGSYAANPAAQLQFVIWLSVQGLRDVTWRSMRLHRFFERSQKLLQLQNSCSCTHVWGENSSHCLEFDIFRQSLPKPIAAERKDSDAQDWWEIHGNLSNRDGPWWTEQDDASWTGMVWRHDGTSVI